MGETNDEIVENDTEYINGILKKLRVQAEPETIIRLGKRNETKNRVLKISMKSKADK